MDFFRIATKLFFMFATLFFCSTANSQCPKVIGGKPISRSILDTDGWTLLNTGNPITCDGYITGWRFFPKVSAKCIALVMRPFMPAAGSYVVIGRTMIPKQTDLYQVREFVLDKTNWISVKTGDVIGFKFETGLLPFDNGGSTFRYGHGISEDALLRTRVITLTGVDSRTYSFQALLKESILPCYIINWPSKKQTSTQESSLSKVWMDDWNKIKCPGKITGWRFVAADSGEVVALVYRQLDFDNIEYEIIGKTVIPVQEELGGIVEFSLSTSEQIEVLPGDKIGFAFNENDQLYVEKVYSNADSLIRYKGKPDVLEVGTTIQFSNKNNLKFGQYMFEPVLSVDNANHIKNFVADHKLENSNIASMTSISRLTCVAKCLQNQECKSVNYNRQDKTCKLNDATDDEDPVNFIEGVGEEYIETSNKFKVVETNCVSVDCGPGNICIYAPESVGGYLCVCSETGYLMTQCPTSECLAPLGMESRSIHDGQITADSFALNDNHAPKCGRLENGKQGGCIKAWAASLDLGIIHHWFQVHLIIEHKITGIQTQGRGDGSYSQWVTSYSISYFKVNETGETFISESYGIPKIFDGNWGKNSIQTTHFNPVIQGVAIRIYPKSWSGAITLRAEILGCRIGNEWVRVFKGISMTGQSIYDAWINGAGTSSYHAHQFLTSNTFYRNNVIMNNWSSKNIQKVKMTLFSAFNKELISMVFNGVGTTESSWFTKDNLESSPWNDLAQASTNHFSMEGEAGRRFYINSYYNTCYGDKGWFSIIEGNVCKSWDGYSLNPRILYSRTKTSQVWHHGDFGTAKTITIDVKMGW